MRVVCRDARRRVLSCLGIATLLFVTGCEPSPSASDRAPLPYPDDLPLAESETNPTAVEAPNPASPRETWDVLLVEGHKIGHSHTTVREFQEQGRPLVEWTNESHLTLQRFNQTVSQQIRSKSVETPEGRVVRFETEMETGGSTTRMVGHSESGKLRIQTTTDGKTTSKTIDWDPGWRGYFGDQQSLERQPMKPGEKRTLRALIAGTVQVGDIELEAIGRETTSLRDGDRELLRIESVTRIAGAPIKSVLWVDAKGQPERSQTSLGGLLLDSYRTTQQLALAPAAGRGFDLGERTVVRVKAPLPSPHQSKRIVYRARLKEGDPSRTFVNSSTQRVRPIDEHVAQITVRSVRPGDANGSEFAAPDPPTDADRLPNNLIQSDDAAIIKLAASVAPHEADPWLIAVALEKHVGDYVRTTTFSQAMASAADVVRSGEGDCTEHAVLLAALCRARGIPSRAAIGLVYFAPRQAFAYHMWNEVWIDDQWIPLDATLGRGGIGAAHIKVAHADLSGESPIAELLPVVRVLGQLDLEILSVE